MEKKEALSTLRDAMATMMYDMIEHHSPPIRRSELAGDIRLAYMNERRIEYLKTRWTSIIMGHKNVINCAVVQMNQNEVRHVPVAFVNLKDNNSAENTVNGDRIAYS